MRIEGLAGGEMTRTVIAEAIGTEMDGIVTGVGARTGTGVDGIVIGVGVRTGTIGVGGTKAGNGRGHLRGHGQGQSQRRLDADTENARNQEKGYEITTVTDHTENGLRLLPKLTEVDHHPAEVPGVYPHLLLQMIGAVHHMILGGRTGYSVLLLSMMEEVGSAARLVLHVISNHIRIGLPRVVLV